MPIEHIVSVGHHLLKSAELAVEWPIEREAHWPCVGIATISNTTEDHGFNAGTRIGLAHLNLILIEWMRIEVKSFVARSQLHNGIELLPCPEQSPKSSRTNGMEILLVCLSSVACVRAIRIHKLVVVHAAPQTSNEKDENNCKPMNEGRR